MTREQAIRRVRKLQALAGNPGSEAEGKLAARLAAKLIKQHTLTPAELGAVEDDIEEQTFEMTFDLGGFAVTLVMPRNRRR
jgi:hypothetical protein